MNKKTEKKCWSSGCKTPASVSIRVKLAYPEAWGTLKHDACRDHFRLAWKQTTKPIIENYLKYPVTSNLKTSTERASEGDKK